MTITINDASATTSTMTVTCALARSPARNWLLSDEEGVNYQVLGYKEWKKTNFGPIAKGLIGRDLTAICK